MILNRTSDGSDNSQNVGTEIRDPFPSEREARSHENSRAFEASVQSRRHEKDTGV
jgi:hypothetical protein